MSAVTAAQTDSWLAALRRITLVPPAHREATVDRAGALGLLRCPAETLDLLVEAGLPVTGEGDERRFCHYDLINLGLYSGSGNSLPEIGWEFAFRFSLKPAATWTEPRSWRMTATLRCPDGGCGTDPGWLLHRPVPELTGGAASGWTSAAGPVTVTDDEVRLPAVPDLVTVDLDLVTAGRADRIVSPRLARLFADIRHGGPRFQMLPSSWQVDPDDTLANGVVNCVSASLYLERECRAMGYEAYARRGWLIGMMDLDHAWLEVRDDDGRIKAVDPVMALLARLLPGDRTAFEEFCIGSSLNRVLPCACRAEGPMAVHHCGGRTRPLAVGTTIKPLRPGRPRADGPLP
ncbi:hypothetical protein [Micromonospora humida]|uniref:PH domain-containing protein n=1 Tax=Micromonospora humida TaxID=2809018 RepID=A0ABS2IM36_9ACTN|nr:hypothetical protein [Micromonospora humida]MBM7075407.1 hypothetical protein [Micromonospora humida]